MSGAEKYFSKVILKKGVGVECPNEGSLCLVNIWVTQGEMNILLEENNVRWHLGQDFGYVSEILNECLEEMHCGEICRVTLHLCDELQDHLKSFNTSEQLAVDYKIELVAFEKEKSSWELTFLERCQFAKDHKDKGTRYYKAGLWLFAARHYSKALKSLILARPHLPSESGREGQFCLLETQCYSNLAACQLKLQRYQHVVENCTKVLNIDPANIKALYRRAQAFVAVNEFEKAEGELNKVLELDPGNRETLELKRRLDGRVREHDAATAKAMSKMFQK